MNQNKLFSDILNLEPPWYIERSSLEKEEKQLDIYINYDEDYKFTCPKCNKQNYEIVNTSHNTWEYFYFFDNKTYIHAKVPQIKCSKCGITKFKFSWERRQNDRRERNDRRLDNRRLATDRRD